LSEFRGTARFEVLRRIGAGGMGVVFEAFDREQRLRVALKTLQRADAAGLLQIKQEFRALRDVSHPSLVSLGELFEDGGQWFFTMELVSGTDFVEHVRGPDGASSESTTRTATLAASTVVEEPSASGDSSPRDSSPGDRRLDAPAVRALSAAEETRLRGALGQLIDAVDALHAHGMVHRDLKPSNVLVTPEGRVVVLDFGLVTSAASTGGTTQPKTVSGTPRYMAPEQITRADVGPAADWYSVGVMLYVSLTGQAPLTGKASDVMRSKLRVDVAPPSKRAPGLPTDLDHLCARLLQRDPDMRPTCEELRERWGSLRTRSVPDPAPSTAGSATAASVTTATASATASGAAASRATGPSPFVGRSDELEALAEHALRARLGEAPCAVVTGESGLGKTALVREVLRRIHRDVPDALVLTGRSHERESVPFKAVDGVVDGLTRHLLSLAPSERAALSDPRAQLLTQLFPVLRHVPELAQQRAAQPAGGEAREQRRRAFEALRALFAQLASTRLVVLVLDDLQWADIDSLQLLQELLHDPRPAGLSVLATARVPRGTTWQPPSMTIEELLGTGVRILELARLGAADGVYLLRALLPGGATLPDDVADHLVASANGHPMFIHELARHARGGDADAALGLDDALWARIEKLEPPVRGVLLRVALAGIPISNEALGLSSRLSGPEYAHAISRLCEGNLVRLVGRRRSDTVEPFHDRVRETVARHAADDDRRRAHAELARAIETTAPDEHETLATHWEAAGQRASAARHAELAARAAEGMLAFDRAARLYASCIALSEGLTDLRRRELSIRRAEALVNGGRNAEAAASYVEIAERAPSDEALPFKRIAAERYLQAGHLREGLPRLDEALAPLGLSFRPTSPWTLFALLLERVRVRMRGFGYVERAESEIDRATLEKLDVLAAATSALGHLDPVAASKFSSRFVRTALEAGEPRRVARALICEWSYETGLQARPSARSRRLGAEIEALIARLDDPYARAFWHLQQAVIVLSSGGDPPRSLQHALEAQALLATCRGVAWESTFAELFHMGSLHYLGRWSRLKVMAREGYRLARQSRDHTRLVTSIMNIALLMEDHPDELEEKVLDAMAPYQDQPTLAMTYHEAIVRSHIALYRGDDGAWLADLESASRRVSGIFLDRIPIVGTTLAMQRARCLVAVTASGPSMRRRDGCRRAARLVARFRRSQMAWARYHASVLDAAIAHLEGDDEAAVRWLEHAERGFRASDIALYPEIAKHRRGALIGGAAGAELVASAEAYLRAEGVVCPERIVRAIAPGFD
jgi:serine/threonine protein kinase